MTVREGATDAQIADALRQGPPHLTDPARGKQPRDTSEDALLQLQTLHHSHREETHLFFMTVREGVTDTQITDALRQGLPHLTDPASL